MFMRSFVPSLSPPLTPHFRGRPDRFHGVPEIMTNLFFLFLRLY